jgi:hypothetical protein
VLAVSALPHHPQVDARLSFNTEASIAKGRALIALCAALPFQLSHFPSASQHLTRLQLRGRRHIPQPHPHQARCHLGGPQGR